MHISDRPGKQNEKAVENVKKQTDSFIDYNRSDIIFDGEQHVFSAPPEETALRSTSKNVMSHLMI